MKIPVAAVQISPAVGDAAGNLALIAPDGSPLAELGEEADLLLGRIDLECLQALRADGLHGLHNRRPECYAPLVDPRTGKPLVS